MKALLRATLAFICGAILAVVIGVSIAWPTIERAAAPWMLARTLHASDVNVGSVRDRDGAIELMDLRLHNADATITFSAPSVRVMGGGFALVRAALDPTMSLTLAATTPHLAIAEAALEPTAARALFDAIRDDGIGSRKITLSFDGGTATIGDPDEPGHSVSLAAVEGHVDLTRTRAFYTLGGNEVSKGISYPFELRTSLAGAVQELHASALAIAPLLGIIPGAGIVVRGGLLREVDLHATPGASGGLDVAGTGSFVHLTGALEGSLGEHDFSEARGRFTLHGSYLSVPTLTANLGKAALDAYGEVRDLSPSLGWLQRGSRELALAGRTLAAIAGQPELDTVTLDVDAPGIVSATYHMTNPLGPRIITVVAIDPKVPGVHLDTAIAEDRIISGGERTSALANRTSAIAGINGDYFDIGRTYQPQGMLMSDGHLLRSPTDRAALAIHRDGSVTVDEYRCSGSLTTPHSVLHISEFNDWPAGFGTVVTPAFGQVLRASPTETFVGLAPVATAPSRYRVTEVTRADRELPVKFGVGFGGLDAGALPRPGEIVQMKYGCSPSLAGTVAVLGGGPQLLKDGEWYEDPHPPAPDERPVRWPVVALVSMTDGTLAMVAVDGRHPERAVGMSRPEFGDLLKSLGGEDAMAFDSGGSVTLVARRPGEKLASVRNRPSDENGERWISDGLFVYSDVPPVRTTEAPQVDESAPDADEPSPESTPLETIVNPDLPGNGVVTSPSPQPSSSLSPSPLPEPT